MENLVLVLPEVFISLSIMFLLILGVFKKNSSKFIQNISLLVLLITAVIIFNETFGIEEMILFNGSVIIDYLSSFMKIVMNDGTVKEENFEWTDTVSANIHNFIDSIEGKSKYLFTDVEKFQNISVLEAIYKSSLSKQNEKVESFN